VLVRGLDSTQIDMARLAIDVSVCDPTGASNLTEVRKALASSSAGPALGETRKRTRFAAKVAQAQLLAPDRMPDVAFHPMGFDLNGAWGPSSLRILDFTAALSSLPTMEPQVRIKRRSVQIVSRTMSQIMRASTARDSRCPSPTRSNVGLNRSRADSLPLAHR
jgi:hypothetical protein